VAHHHDLGDVELRHRELQRRGDAVAQAADFKRRDERRDVADDEDFARRGIEHDHRIDSAVRAGDDQDLGMLLRSKLSPAFAVVRPFSGAEVAIAFDQLCKIAHAAAYIRAGRAGKSPPPSLSGRA
jgi:hypothetical protein